MNVNAPSQNSSEDTPLHTAARLGVPELAALYLARGASVDALNALQETPLMTAAFWAFDPKEQAYSQDHHVVCRLLLDHRAGECPLPGKGLYLHFFYVKMTRLTQIQTSGRRTRRRRSTKPPGTPTTS